MGSELAQYTEIAANKKAYRSCIMVEELPYLHKFHELGITEIETNENGVLIVDVPMERIDDFVDLYTEVMKPGRWNEYVGPKTGFYFKMPNGEIRHILLNSTEGKEKINKTLQEFIPNWDPNTDLWKWLASIDIYSSWFTN